MPSRLLLKRNVSRFMATYANMATCCERYAQQATMEQQLLHEMDNAQEGQWVDLQLLIGHVLTQLLGHSLQVLEADLTCLIIIKQLERLQQPDSSITHMPYTGHLLADMWTASPMRDIRKMPETLMLQSSCLEDLLLAVALAHLGGHHGQELIKVDGAAAILVYVGNHLLHLLLLRLKPQRPA